MKKILFLLALLSCAGLLAAAETACVYDLKGGVEIMKSGKDGWHAARKGSPVGEGDRLRTGDGAWCELLFKDGTFVKMDEGSETAADTLKAGAGERMFSFSFLKGRALWMAAKIKGKSSSFTVRTPTAVCAVRGTDFSMIVSTAGETSVGLFDGVVALSSGTVEKQLLAGGEADAGAGAILVRERLSRLMKAEERRYARIKARVENLRKRLAERDAFIDDYVNRQQKTLSGLEDRRREKLKDR